MGRAGLVESLAWRWLLRGGPGFVRFLGSPSSPKLPSSLLELWHNNDNMLKVMQPCNLFTPARHDARALPPEVLLVGHAK